VATVADCIGISARIFSVAGPAYASPIDLGGGGPVEQPHKKPHNAAAAHHSTALPSHLPRGIIAALTIVMEPKCNPDYEFSSRCYENPIYNVFVALLFKRSILLGGGIFVVFLLTIAACLWVIPQPHRPLQYMVAGSVATAVALAAGFAVVNRLPNSNKPLVRIRIARRNDS
jgi:hypothetical protein